MASGLDWLFQGNAPPNIDTSITSTGTQPAWYQQYLQGIAGKATQIASTPYQAYPGQRVADLTPDQTAAASTIEQGQGSWQPGLDAASGLSVQGATGAQAGVTDANAAAAGPAATWTNNWQSYMSPYTSSVVDEIGRLGNQNLQENILPGVATSFIGSGQFGSARNANILGNSIRDAQAGITGQQASALETGYTTAANIFGSDANRAQQQQQMQATTALQGGQLASSAGDTAAARQQSLATAGSNLNLQDANALDAVGAEQQANQQQSLNTGYNDFLNEENWDWSQLGNLSAALNGQQPSAGSQQITNAPAANYSASPLAQLAAIYGLAAPKTSSATA